ncbi:YceI family protein [Paraflavitalea speifideaquila]|uniref:YceI family protein n=1 Tax=Paraflavitalea speifideaquila TaxID=3076558 RepID=UPI0028E35CE5|nr:YceI family protein [Paraflavitalea speifideiaquila]
MRKQTLLWILLLPGACHIISCREAAKATVPTVEITGTPATPAPVAAAVGYELQPRESILYWKGNPVVGSGHAGTLKAESGNLAIDANGKLAGGYFVLDMNSILSTDPVNKGPEDGLVQHLKDPDFFDVPKYPKAYFTLVKADPGANDSSFTITGQLKMKDKINEITFPATLLNQEIISRPKPPSSLTGPSGVSPINRPISSAISKTTPFPILYPYRWTCISNRCLEPVNKGFLMLVLARTAPLKS